MMPNGMQRSQPSTLQGRVRTAIIEAAADVLAREGSGNMNEVAKAAGVSRATVYRYFRSRDELIAALGKAAYEEATQRVRDAKLDDVPFSEAIARTTRALVLTGNHYIVLARQQAPYDPGTADPTFEETMNRLFDRGKQEGFLRPDLDTLWFRAAYRGVVVYGLRYAATHDLGVEETAALITEQFLHGAAGGQVAKGSRRRAQRV
jgi:TetR/AcrR family transcriptional repressor of mexCD-oprJ operon